MKPQRETIHKILVLRSLFSVESIAQLLERIYGLTDVSCQFIKGTIRDTYLVQSSQGSYILSIYPHSYRSEEEILAELSLLSHLSSRQFNVPLALPQSNGETLLKIDAPEGLRFGVLFEFIEGKQLSKSPDPKTARGFGKLLAELHLSTGQIPLKLLRPQIEFILLIERALSAFENAARNRPADIDYLHRAAEKIQSGMNSLTKGSPEYGIVHGDVIPSNMLVTPTGQLALIDFDFCGYGWRVYDIATFLTEVEYWSMGAAVRDAFQKGYQEVRKLSSDERSAIPLFEAARNIFSLGIPAQNVNTWGSAYQNDRMIDIHIQNIKKTIGDMD